MIRTIVSLLGQIYGWDSETREFISSVHKDGRSEIVRSRISAKVWNYFLSGMSIRLFRELCDVKEKGREHGAIDAVMLYRGNKKEKIVLLWNTAEGLYSVSYGKDRVLNYGDLDRAMLMFSLILETKMNERMQLMAT